ncbi:bifunctional DNA-formamidopyrimidine glycosylase/DNA-(apurinic or apyrimidinic site) lyase [Ahrensia sp. R2A130]|uniref:bifunctional DNA-formamidopyrimidine glycosylase/DNA-(apurinic or apyrimidinic site) lyase n=1 Tax=Ahrensia sp. R2A130 TaxID=744979 RepID=UPI0001E0F0A7|nr:bifunctional DNA-formamidopyrimidine glycosylase/DNA-(apurinic or apyrimidinic site) lyase [Ahrensia sp. R2A130]EFL89910.1 formamidopyrimidine-DNA glycosylase [Ahrensia sp. R2A130]
MPELPEVETVRGGLAPVMEGAVIDRLELRRPDLRFPFPDDFANASQNRRIEALSRRAKYLLMDLDDGTVVIMHLGMSGSFRTLEGSAEAQPGNFHHEKSRDEKHDHVTFHLTTATGEKARVVYNDPRRFGFMLSTPRSELDVHPSFASLGVEPVGNALDADYVAGKLADKNVPMKAALLDQKIIAGLGNIYVCEALWRARLSPRRKARTLVQKSGRPTPRLEELVVHIRNVIADAIKAGGSTLRDHAATDGTLGYFQHTFAAYDQEGQDCQRVECSGTITRIVQSGRSTFYCPRCQR